MKILNLGCGSKTSSDPDIMNIDWSILLRIRRNPLLRMVAPLLLTGERRRRFNELPDNVLVHDLAKGIPFADATIEAVYHSHVLEHLDRDVAEMFLVEVKRVLKPNGVHRIVVPDLEAAARAYLAHLDSCERDATEAARHDSYVSGLLEQSVRREAHGTSQQKPLRRFVENLLLGDARRRGETHQWMYDRFNLPTLLLRLGYGEVRVQKYDVSLIPEWNRYGLDIDDSGREYRPGSLYVEARK